MNRTSPAISQTEVVKSYESYMASGDAKAIQGAMLWSCDITSMEDGGKACGDGDDYAVCKGSPDYQELVPQFAAAMAGKAKATSE